MKRAGCCLNYADLKSDFIFTRNACKVNWQKEGILYINHTKSRRI